MSKSVAFFYSAELESSLLLGESLADLSEPGFGAART